MGFGFIKDAGLCDRPSMNQIMAGIGVFAIAFLRTL